jgi:hypothetical protein
MVRCPVATAALVFTISNFVEIARRNRVLPMVGCKIKQRRSVLTFLSTLLLHHLIIFFCYTSSHLSIICKLELYHDYLFSAFEKMKNILMTFDLFAMFCCSVILIHIYSSYSCNHDSRLKYSKSPKNKKWPPPWPVVRAARRSGPRAKPATRSTTRF